MGGGGEWSGEGSTEWGGGGGRRSLVSCQCLRCGLNGSWRVGGPVSTPLDETKSECIQCCRETNFCVYDIDQQTVYALWLGRVLSSTLSVFDPFFICFLCLLFVLTAGSQIMSCSTPSIPVAKIHP